MYLIFATGEQVFAVHCPSVQKQLFGCGHFLGWGTHVFLYAVHSLFPYAPAILNFKQVQN